MFEPAADGELDDEAEEIAIEHAGGDELDAEEVGIYAEPITGDPLALASALERIDDEMRTLPDRGPDRAAARARRRHGTVTHSTCPSAPYAPSAADGAIRRSTPRRRRV